MDKIVELLGVAVGAGNVVSGDDIPEEYTHDEALTAQPVRPVALVRPRDTIEVAAVLRMCDELRVPVTARGSGTGLSGACIPLADGVVCSMERMNRIIEIDVDNHIAVVEPGVTLDQLHLVAVGVGDEADGDRPTVHAGRLHD